MKKQQDKAPAYPQVEFLQDIQEYPVKCRHCLLDIDSEIWEGLSGKDIKAIRAGAFRKWVHKCGNVVKIVLRHGD